MTKPIELNRTSGTSAIVTIGNVEMFFSYAVCIAFRAPGVRFANPRYRGFSKTTSKHFNELGCRDFADVPSEGSFNKSLQAALRKAFSN